MLPCDYDRNHFCKLKIGLMIFWISFVTLIGTVQKQSASNIDKRLTSKNWLTVAIQWQTLKLFINLSFWYVTVNFCATRIQFLNSLSQLVKFQRIVEQDIKTELEKDFDNRQRMLPTHVSKLPDGTEVGDYIVLDFGGKFFRTGIQEPNKHNQVYNHQFHLIFTVHFRQGWTFGESFSQSRLCKH